MSAINLNGSPYYVTGKTVWDDGRELEWDAFKHDPIVCPMKNKNEIINNAKNITVINDGQFRYPVLTLSLTAWVSAHGKITATNYEQFCADVDCIGEKEIGTPGSGAMVELCNDLISAGADVENLG